MILRRMRQMSNEKRVYSLLKSEKISVGRGEDGANLCSIPHNENKEVYNVNSYSFRIAFKSFWKKEYGELLNDKEVQEMKKSSLLSVMIEGMKLVVSMYEICRTEKKKRK